ncbi:leucine-rich repeat domain-containing protein [Actimicrobium sp. CCC2.4]|uniref:leucine-rich repeat domain-containing protein n=1 Tax=Actimicrobium sp. CCC2.4 TaxID=3048606 RepID=UPI002B253D27|nr:leucine-rich repeat domain-containing protein [Actimicrobium sp. CCC2.4]MEB0137072.1 leucine-rich repeat domain-containing protein [Actimicrobium sp. CCC2.4]
MDKLALRTLPDCIGDLKSLQLLAVMDNKLTRLTDRVGDLSKLGFLFINHNKLTELPDSIADLSKLCALIVDNNQLTELPEWVAKSSKIFYLEVSVNPLLFSSERVRNMPAFEGSSRNHELLHLPNTPPTPAPHASLATDTITASPTDQPTLTPDQHHRIEQFLAANPASNHPTFTTEDRTNLNTFLSIQDAINTLIIQPAPAPGASIPHEEMNKLINFMQIKFADDLEKQQWEAEIGALKTVHAATAKSGLLLYNLLFGTLIGLHKNSPQLFSGAANINAGAASSGGALIGKALNVLNLMPMGGNQLASAARAAFDKIDQQHVARDLLTGLNAMASIGNTGTRLQQEPAMQRLTHALVYRLTLHHCDKLSREDGMVMRSAKSMLGIDDRSITNFQNYAVRITDAIMSSESANVFKAGNLDDVITHLLTGALTSFKRSSAEARKTAMQLAERHGQIIGRLEANAGPVDTAPARPALRTINVRDLRSSSGWVRPRRPCGRTW